MASETPPQKIARVGLGVMILKDGKMLLGKRKNSHGDGEYATPGGHLEFNESPEDCAYREIAEECGVEIKNLKFQHLANLVDSRWGTHYIRLGFFADWAGKDPLTLEPDKCEGWDWYDLDNLPQPLFYGTEFYVKAYRGEGPYFDLKR